MALPEGVVRQGGISFSQTAPGCQGQRPAKAQAWVGEGGFRGWRSIMRRSPARSRLGTARIRLWV
jgi:hypothetical protein